VKWASCDPTLGDDETVAEDGAPGIGGGAGKIQGSLRSLRSVEMTKFRWALEAARVRPGLILSRMDVERARAFLLTLPHVVETMQWGDNLVFWVGDKAIGGKMFCLLNLDAGAHGVVSYSAGPERFAELVEQEGIVPAPYMARIHWAAVERWDVLRNAEWESELRAAHDITLAKLPKGVREVLAMSERARAKVIAERRKVLATRKKAGPQKRKSKGGAGTKSS
jgi:predicted DNA-binding protein (MmcQ/YjbR family)